jgi:CRP/FNR family transcriptional regulator, cyclic AMP receptor protein
MSHVAIDELRNVWLFADLSDAELEKLAERFVDRTFAEGDVVVEEGATGTSVFVIVEGDVSVSVGGEPKATLGPGDYFGEMAIMDDGRRSASIVAATDLRVCFLTPWEFRPFVEEHPELAWKLLCSLARKLRAAQTHD